MSQRSLVSIDDYSKEEYLEILRLAAEFEENPVQDLLGQKVIASLFFEPSTRTRLSFESAIHKLGGKVIGFSEANTTSVTKGETIKDTIKMVSNYCDLIVMRHNVEGSVRFASEVANVPVINAGDGANQHPTQTLLDLYSIQKTQERLENLQIMIVGDLKYGRTVHSLVMALSKFTGIKFYFVSPDELGMPKTYKDHLKEAGTVFEEYSELTKDLIDKVDIIYMTRVQKERFSDPIEYERNKNIYVLKKAMLGGAKPTMKILHPLPRVNEIDEDIDQMDHAYYFEQSLNGVYTRQAIICKILGLV